MHRQPSNALRTVVWVVSILLAGALGTVAARSADPPSARAPFVGTWTKGEDVLAISSDGTYIRGGRLNGADIAFEGTWEPTAAEVIDMTDPRSRTSVRWKVSSDAMTLLLRPKTLERTGGVVYTRVN